MEAAIFEDGASGVCRVWGLFSRVGRRDEELGVRRWCVTASLFSQGEQAEEAVKSPLFITTSPTRFANFPSLINFIHKAPHLHSVIFSRRPLLQP